MAVDIIYEALGKAIPEQLPASSGGDICSMMLVGQHPQTDRWYVEGGNEGVGWGATASHDGQNALMHITQSTVRNTPIEIIENKAPIRIQELGLRQDSGGPGKYRGGLGVIHSYQFTAPGEALATVKKTKTKGWGLQNGKPGATNSVVWSRDSNGEKHTGTERKEMEPGDTVTYLTGGGGGFGDPMERDPESVLNDVINGYVSQEQAREEYGVVITDDHSIDQDKTNELRNN